jgi:hypothetical protein
MNPAPPKISPVNARLAILVLGMAGAGVAAVVYFFNPSSHAFYPVCQFHRLTGLNCPGCGGTRALYALLHGHLAEALRDNALFIVGAALAAIRGGWLGLKRIAGRPAGGFFPPNFLWPLLVVVFVFAVLRNLPAFAFLSP